MMENLSVREISGDDDRVVVRVKHSSTLTGRAQSVRISA